MMAWLTGAPFLLFCTSSTFLALATWLRWRRVVALPWASLAMAGLLHGLCLVGVLGFGLLWQGA